MTALDPIFLTVPLAHRGLHDRKAARVENSPSAFAAAMAAGYGIELDLQLSADGRAMVFHDDRLDRLTTEIGPVAGRSAAELAAIGLTGGGDRIPTFAQVLAQIGGRVPLLVEIKDQDGALGADVGRLETAAAAALESYLGPVAVMSFNPHSVAAMAARAPQTPRGLVTEAFAPAEWPGMPEDRLARLAAMEDYDRTGACFISHDRRDLGSPHVAAIRARGAAVLTWTVHSPAEERDARRYAQNITFEGYLPAVDQATADPR